MEKYFKEKKTLYLKAQIINMFGCVGHVASCSDSSLAVAPKWPQTTREKMGVAVSQENSLYEQR